MFLVKPTVITPGEAKFLRSLTVIAIVVGAVVGAIAAWLMLRTIVDPPPVGTPPVDPSRFTSDFYAKTLSLIGASSVIAGALNVSIARRQIHWTKVASELLAVLGLIFAAGLFGSLYGVAQ